MLHISVACGRAGPGDGLANERRRVRVSFLSGFLAVRGRLGSGTPGTRPSEAVTANPTVPETRGQKRGTGDPPKAWSRVTGLRPSPNCHKRATGMRDLNSGGPGTLYTCDVSVNLSSVRKHRFTGGNSLVCLHARGGVSQECHLPRALGVSTAMRAPPEGPIPLATAQSWGSVMQRQAHEEGLGGWMAVHSRAPGAEAQSPAFCLNSRAGLLAGPSTVFLRQQRWCVLEKPQRVSVGPSGLGRLHL